MGPSHPRVFGIVPTAVSHTMSFFMHSLSRNISVDIVINISADLTRARGWPHLCSSGFECHLWGNGFRRQEGGSASLEYHSIGGSDGEPSGTRMPVGVLGDNESFSLQVPPTAAIHIWRGLVLATCDVCWLLRSLGLWVWHGLPRLLGCNDSHSRP